MSPSAAGERQCGTGMESTRDPCKHALGNVNKNVPGSTLHNNKILDTTQCQSTKEQINKTQYIHKMVYHIIEHNNIDQS